MHGTRVKRLMQETHTGNVLPSRTQIATDFTDVKGFYLEATSFLNHILPRQGPWNADLRTPPGPEGSNGSLLYICRGHPGTFFPIQNEKCKIQN
jgi:hypothetical protein